MCFDKLSTNGGLMRALYPILIALPGLAHAAAPHTGQVIHDGFQLSDVALFAFAAFGVWLAQRSMRRRARGKAGSQLPFVSSEVEKP